MAHRISDTLLTSFRSEINSSLSGQPEIMNFAFVTSLGKFIQTIILRKNARIRCCQHYRSFALIEKGKKQLVFDKTNCASETNDLKSTKNKFTF